MTRSPHYLPSFCGRFVISTDNHSAGATVYAPHEAASLLSTYRAKAWEHAQRGEECCARICLQLGNELSDALDKAAEWLGEDEMARAA